MSPSVSFLANYCFVQRDANALVEMKARHSQEAKGLLVMIRYLKLRITREAAFRDDMSYQKAYLSTLIREKQSTCVLMRCILCIFTCKLTKKDPRRIDSTMSTLVQLGLPRPAAPRRTKLSFKGAAVAIVAMSRMRSAVPVSIPRKLG